MAKKKTEVQHDWYEIADNGYEVTFGLGNGPIKTINAQTEENKERGRSTVIAANDFFFLEGYVCPGVGVHLYANPSEDAFGKRVGYVAQWHTQGDKYPRPAAGWMPIEEINGIYRLTDFISDSQAKNATTKHDIIDAWLLGHRLQVNLIAKMNYFNTFLAKWTMDDQEKARRESIQRKKDLAYYGLVSGQTQEENTARHGTQRMSFVPDQRRIVDPETVILNVKGDTSVNLAQLIPGHYRLVNQQGRFICTEQWTGYNADRWNRLKKIYKLETMPEQLVSVE